MFSQITMKLVEAAELISLDHWACTHVPMLSEQSKSFIVFIAFPLTLIDPH